MDKYKRVDNPKPVTEIQENEIRITTQGKMRSYIAYATNLFQKGNSEVILKAMGRAINKTVTIAEIIKRRIPGLHQNTAIDSTPITEVWEPIEEGLERVETTRLVSSIQITLSSGQLDVNSPGYQPPLPDDQIRNVSPGIRPRVMRGAGRGFRRGTRGLRRGRGGPNQAVQDQTNPTPLQLPNPGFQQDQNQSSDQGGGGGLRRPPRFPRGRARMGGFNQPFNTNINTPTNPGVNNYNNPGYNNNNNNNNPNNNTGFNPGYNNTGFNTGYNGGGGGGGAGGGGGYNTNFNSGFRGRGRGRGRGGRGRGRGGGGRARGQFMGFAQNQPRVNTGFRNNNLPNPSNIIISNQKSPSQAAEGQDTIILA